MTPPGARRASPSPMAAPDLAPEDLAVGLDVGGTKTQGVLYGAAGTLATVTLPTTRGVPGVVGTVVEVTRRLLGQAASRTPGASLRVVGIGIPGVVDTAAGTVSHGVNLGLDEADVPLARLVGEALGVPAVVANDVTVATLGAARATGAGDDVALLSIGTGLAAGLVLDGVTRPGAFHGAGEIGHIPYILDGPVCNCGQRGCLELYASGSALARMRPVPEGVAPAVDLFRAVDRGDPAARAAQDRWMDALAHAVTILCLTVDVPTVLLAGGVTRAGERFLRGLREALGRRAAGSPFLRQVDLADRLVLVDPDLAVAPLGACLAAIEAVRAPRPRPERVRAVAAPAPVRTPSFRTDPLSR